MKNRRKHGMAVFTALAFVLMMCMDTAGVYATEVTTEVATSEYTIDSAGAVVAYTGPGGDITLPGDATSIAANAFASNSSITSVTIPANIVLIGNAAFANCTSLTTVSIQGSISAIPAQLFYNCANLRSVSVPVSVTSIGSEAFAECVSLAGITIPAAVSSIGDRAFYDCYSMTGVAIPAATSSISSSAFAACTSLTTYSVASGSAYYASSDGCLYNSSLTRLINVPEGKSGVTIASTTRTIGSGAFNNCVGVSTLSIPASVTTIETNAFSGSGISNITIPDTVTSIGAQSSWTAAVIYGYDPSTAETYATTNSIVFESLGSAGTGRDTETEDPTDPTDPENPGDSEKKNNETGAGNNNNPGTTGGTGNETNGSTTTTTAVKTSGNGAGSNTSAAATHEKDSTPTTGDGINPAFVLCFALLLVGIYFVMMGRKKSNTTR